MEIIITFKANLYNQIFNSINKQFETFFKVSNFGKGGIGKGGKSFLAERQGKKS